MAAVVVASLFALAGLMLWGAPAEALVTHKYEGRIAEVPAEGPHGPVTSPGSLGLVHGLAVESGELYVQDDRVDAFDDGSLDFVGQPSLPGIVFGDAASEQQLYANAEHAVDVYGPGVCGDVKECPVLQKEWTGADTPQGSFSLITNLAVDHSTAGGDWASGDVILATPQSDVVDVFRPQAGGEETFIETAQLKGTPLEGEPATGQGEPFQFPNRIAISGLNGDLIVNDARAEGPVIDIFQPVGAGEYAFVTRVTRPNAGFVESLAVDGANGDIYAGVQREGTHGIVEEFDAAGGPVATIDGAETPSGNLREATSLAVDPVSHRVFVGDFRESEIPRQGFVDVYGGDEVAPDVVTGSPEGTQPESATHTWAATLTGTVDPDSAGEATCQFVWGTTTSFGNTTKCAQAVPDGSEPVAVQAPLTELQPGTTYFYKLQAQNEHANNPGEGFAEYKTPGPTLAGQSVAEVSSTGATLKATINPNSQPTSYRFEYDTTPYTPGQAAHGTSIPAAFASIGAGSANVEVEAHIQHLTPDSTYHYRVVTITEYEPGKTEEFDEADHTLTTQDIGGDATLPDGRAWELVSPPDKHGAAIFGLIKGFQAFQSATEAAADGHAMTYTALSPTEAEPAGYTGVEQIFSSRSPSGWSSVDLSPPHNSATALEEEAEYPFFSEDLSTGVAQLGGIDHTLLSSAASESTPYVRSSSCVPPPSGTGNCYMPLVTTTEGEDDDVPPGTVFGGTVEALDATPDMQHIMLRSAAQLTETSTEGHKELYEWTESQVGLKRLQLVSVLPPSEGGQPATQALIVGNEAVNNVPGGERPIDANGSRIFWSTGPAEHHQALYMRDTAHSRTIRLDLPEPGVPGGVPGARFQAASADGSRVFFTDTERLVSSASVRGADLYECVIAETASGAECTLTDLTPETSGASEVQENILGAANDGSYVYFVAEGVLPGAPSGTQRGNNLYVAHAGTVQLIARLSPEDHLDWGVGGSGPTELVNGFVGPATARVSPNGRFAAFMSHGSLTGYDNRDAQSGKLDAEVYLYEAQASRLVCASCDPSGARPNGVEIEAVAGGDKPDLAAIRGEAHAWVAADLPPGTPIHVAANEALYGSRLLSDSGRLFFNSSDGLASRDVNGQEDVYEFEPVGVGGCVVGGAGFHVLTGGCTSLISSGTAGGESGVLDASEGGDDVFFLTGGQLVKRDTDSAVDVYDAHVCSAGAPCTVEQDAPSACATADACRAAPAPQPSVFGAGPSETFSGADAVPDPAPVPTAASRAKPLSQAQRLALALKACRKKSHRRERRSCERSGRRKYARPAEKGRGK